MIDDLTSLEVSISSKVKPVNEDHSIKFSRIRIYLYSPILKPRRFQKLIEEDLKDKFQVFEPLSIIELQFKGQGINLQSTETSVQKDTGFRFISFEKGRPQRSLLGLNDERGYFLEYKDFSYSGWTAFFNDCKSYLLALLKIQPDFFVSGYSLEYADEFLWIDQGNDIDKSLLFNESCNYLPRIFFDAHLTNYNIVIEGDTEKKERFTPQLRELLRITIERRMTKNISILHNFTKPLEDTVELSNLIVSNEFKEILDSAHSRNTELLRGLLKKELLEMINL